MTEKVPKTNEATPVVALSIAGSDSSGGAGIQADLKTFAAHGVYGCSVLSAVTAQNSLGIRESFVIPSSLLRAQFLAIKEDFRPRAVKTGMLGSRDNVREVARLLGRPPLPLVVDPVLFSSSGSPLMEPAGLEIYRRELIPLATILTPNLDEASRLLEGSPIQSLEDMKAAAKALLTLGSRSVYLKGGHLEGDFCIDIFFDGEYLELREARVLTRNSHGTGCTLASALCANLAKGLALRDAAKAAKRYLQSALLGAQDWELGKGRGPLDHFPDRSSTQ